MSIIDELITDRSQVDVNRWRELRDKTLSNMTDSEKQEWLSTAMRGAYNHTDMNRVGEAVLYLAKQMESHGYTPPTVNAKTDWTVNDKPSDADMQTYYDNLDAIAKVVDPNRGFIPRAPLISDKLDWVLANRIETILKIADSLLSNKEQSVFYAGDIFAGEV